MPSSLDHWRAVLTVARGLGPGAPTQGPSGRSRLSTVSLVRPDGSLFDVVLRVPKGAVRGALLVVPGIHFHGVADPRLVRFAQVLAAAGIVVCTPELQDHVALVPSPRAIDDLSQAFALLLAQPSLPRGCRPGVWSVSFGAYAALALAASESWQGRVGGLFLFGPFASLGRALSHALDPSAVERDPLVRPVVYLWVLYALVEDAGHRALLAAALRAYVHETWSIAPPPTKEQRAAVFERLSMTLPDPSSRILFRSATLGVGPDPRIDTVLRDGAERFRFLEPATWAARVRAPVTIVHGREDRTMPFQEASALATLLSPHTPTEVLVTGFYAHTESDARPGPRALAGEVVTLAKVVDRLVRTATRGFAAP